MKIFHATAQGINTRSRKDSLRPGENLAALRETMMNRGQNVEASPEEVPLERRNRRYIELSKLTT